MKLQSSAARSWLCGVVRDAMDTLDAILANRPLPVYPAGGADEDFLNYERTMYKSGVVPTCESFLKDEYGDDLFTQSAAINACSSDQLEKLLLDISYTEASNMHSPRKARVHIYSATFTSNAELRFPDRASAELSGGTPLGVALFTFSFCRWMMISAGWGQEQYNENSPPSFKIPR